MARTEDLRRMQRKLELSTRMLGGCDVREQLFQPENRTGLYSVSFVRQSWESFMQVLSQEESLMNSLPRLCLLIQKGNFKGHWISLEEKDSACVICQRWLVIQRTSDLLFWWCDHELEASGGQVRPSAGSTTSRILAWSVYRREGMHWRRWKAISNTDTSKSQRLGNWG